MYPDCDKKPEINYDSISKKMVAADVVFNKPNTLFLAEAGKRGAKTINGLGMLANQGAMNFKLWTGGEAPLAVMEQTLRQEFGLEEG